MVPSFFKTADEIAASLATQPATADELARVVEPMKQQITRMESSPAFFMWQIEGATADPARIAGLRRLFNDYVYVTPAQLQALAKQYLGADKAWRLAVVPAAKP